jgi:hypothetical protein
VDTSFVLFQCLTSQVAKNYKNMPRYVPGKVVILFESCPCTIMLPAAPRNQQLGVLRERIIFHANNLVNYGLWEEYLSDAELDEIMTDVEIKPVYFSSFSSPFLWWGMFKSMVKKSLYD